MKKYSVSLVYTSREPDSITNRLRVVILEADSDAAALGLGMKQFDKEMENHMLSLKVVIEIK